MIAIAWMIAGAVLTVLYFVFTHRRHTPYLELDLDSLPPLNDGLQTLAGLTGGAVYDGNRVHSAAERRAVSGDAGGHRGRATHACIWKRSCGTAGELERRVRRTAVRKGARGRQGARADRCNGRVERDSQSARAAERRRRRARRSTAAPRWWNLRRFNHRTHRKLLIVDGEIGYTFGHGIADQWLGDGEDEDHWRDTAVRVEGPVVARAAIGVHGELDRRDALRAGRRRLLSEARSQEATVERARGQQRIR